VALSQQLITFIFITIILSQSIPSREE
jgi:hypothetical protein